MVDNIHKPYQAAKKLINEATMYYCRNNFVKAEDLICEAIALINTIQENYSEERSMLFFKIFVAQMDFGQRQKASKTLNEIHQIILKEAAKFILENEKNKDTEV